MPKFYREAVLAARRIKDPKSDAQIGSLESWPEVADALDGLDPAGRCHAIYSDWLLQLHEPGGDVQIQIRDLLLRQGALAANYLGEMAQNADDSGASSLLVELDGDWLLVANNGRPLSSLNMLGLCRFFVHSNGQVVGLTPETIGKFGIGFKSCHRVADEVFVWSWGANEEFGFRLPICQSGGDAATPESANLALLQEHLNQVGRPLVNLRESRDLGHCTPEVLGNCMESLPIALVERIKKFKTEHSEKGVWFALHLHERGRNEARKRIMEQADAHYELCPLFLNSLRNVTLQNRALQLNLGKTIGRNVGQTKALSITLKLTNSDGSKRNDRLLVLSSCEDDTWQLALPADSEFKIKRPSADQFSLRSGGAYAFLPLPSLNWPWPVHLHLNAPTNLARSDWNPADTQTTHALLRQAAEHCAEWLSTNPDRWHPEWQPADLISQPLDSLAPESSARVFGEAYVSKLSDVPTMRTLWGGLVAPNAAIGLHLEPGDVIRSAWIDLAAIIPEDLKNKYPLVLNSGGTAHLIETTLNTQQAREFFRRIRGCLAENLTASWQNYVRIVVGTEVSVYGGVTRGDMIQNALAPVEMAKPNEAMINFQDASNLQFSVQLKPEWHQFFASLSNWLDPNWGLSGTTVFGLRMSQILRNLSQPAEIPTEWDEVIGMTEADFRHAGGAFWQQHRVECPGNLREKVIQSIWIESGQSWTPLAEFWLGDEPVAMLRNIIHPLEHRADEFNNDRRKRMQQALQRWHLQKTYEQIIQQKIETCAETEFIRRLSDDNPNNPLRLQQLVLAKNWKPERLPLAWQTPVLNAAKKAVQSLFVQSGLNKQPGKTLILGSGPTSEVLLWNRQNIVAPTWLNQESLNWCNHHVMLNQFELKAADTAALTNDQTDDLAESLLKHFHEWQNVKPTPEQSNALEGLFQRATGNWTIGLPGNVNRRINEYCSWRDPGDPVNAITPLECVWSGNEELNFKGCDPLPGILANIYAIRAKAIPIAQFTFNGPDEGELHQMADGEIPDELATNPWFQQLREIRPNAQLMAVNGRPALSWSRGRMEIQIPRASFGFIDGENPVVFVAGVNNAPPVAANDHRYLPVLVAYSQVAPEDTEVARAVRNNRRLAKVYRENREKILARLVQKHANEMGYEAEHVLRELLQNTESAYGTRKAEFLPDVKSFKVILKPQENGSRYEVEISHQGRAFNESDNEGLPCDTDIIKLVSLAADAYQNQENLGRFNRGFKSLFNVTNRVRVRSGGYDFNVEDMLMLNPPEPEQRDDNENNSTMFKFDIEAGHFSKLLRELEGKLCPFLLEELVFLKHTDEIRVEVGDRPPMVFSLVRQSLDNDSQIVTISESRGDVDKINSSCFLIRSAITDHGLVSIAIAVDADGTPIALPIDLRWYYRTFPLREQSHWLNGLLNADFATDLGRTGWRPDKRNGAFVVAALSTFLDVVKERIVGTSGKIELWLAWIKSVERKNLNDASVRLPDHKAHLNQAINEFDGWIWRNLPNGEALCDVSEFMFPSRLLRRIHEHPRWQQVFELDSTRWIDERVAEAIAEFGNLTGNYFDLRSVVARLISEQSDKEELHSTLKAIKEADFGRDLIAMQEIEMAIGLLAQRQVMEYEQLITIWPDGYDVAGVEGEITETVCVADLEDSWNEAHALEQFTLAGWMGELVFAGARRPTEEDRLAILNDNSQTGKMCWHRLLCLGSLLGARVRPAQVRMFWENELAPRNLFNPQLSPEAIGNILDEISHRPFRDLDATGENAEMWRRVFYDFQKIRGFVFGDDLPGNFRMFLQSCDDPQGPINFLKSGFHSQGERWSGVIGQSMTAPLFWVMRELRRIEFIESDAFDSSCFYMNGPARRVAYQLGWLDEQDRRAFSFQDLLRVSEVIFERSSEYTPDLAKHFDLPLQWYAHQNPR